jgi:hypothetical protein
MANNDLYMKWVPFGSIIWLLCDKHHFKSVENRMTKVSLFSIEQRVEVCLVIILPLYSVVDNVNRWSFSLDPSTKLNLLRSANGVGPSPTIVQALALEIFVAR